MNAELKPLPEIARTVAVTVDQARYWLSLLGITPARQGKVRMVPATAAVLLASVARMVTDGVAPGEACRRVIASPTEAPTSIAVANPDNLPVPAGRVDQLERAIMALVESHRQESEARKREADQARADTALLLEAHRLESERHRTQVADLQTRLSAVAATMTNESDARRADADHARRQADDTQQRLAQVRAEVTQLARRATADTAVPTVLLEPPRPVKPWQPPTPAPRLEGWRRIVTHLVNPAGLRRR